MDQGYVYILTNERLNVRTNDLRKRLVHHKRRLIPGFTRKYNVHRLVYFEAHPDMEVASRRERQIKGMSRDRKDALVNAGNRERRDLFETLTNSGKAER
jgi:putative endonuclease